MHPTEEKTTKVYRTALNKLDDDDVVDDDDD